MSELTGNDVKTCSQCLKTFLVPKSNAKDYVYKHGDIYQCSWTCFNLFDKDHSSRKDRLVTFLSKNGKILDFLDAYGLGGTYSAKIQQLEEYISLNFEPKKDKKERR